MPKFFKLFIASSEGSIPYKLLYPLSLKVLNNPPLAHPISNIELSLFINFSILSIKSLYLFKSKSDNPPAPIVKLLEYLEVSL